MKTSIVTLTAEERRALQAWIAAGKASFEAFEKHRIPAAKSDPSATRMTRKNRKTMGKVATPSTLRRENPPNHRANAVGHGQKN